MSADLVKTATSSLGWAESESPMRSLTLWRRLRTRSPAASPIASLFLGPQACTNQKRKLQSALKTELKKGSDVSTYKLQMSS